MWGYIDCDALEPHFGEHKSNAKKYRALPLHVNINRYDYQT